MALPDPYNVNWLVTAEGKSWRAEAMSRYALTPEKTEMSDGKLFNSEAERLRMLGLLLENCGADAAVRFGDPEVWRRAVAALDAPYSNFLFIARAALRQWDAVEDRAAAHDYYQAWTAPDYLEQHAGEQRNIAEVLLSYPESVDWSHFTVYDSQIESADLDGANALLRTIRERAEYAGAARSKQRERWELHWRQSESGWTICKAECLSSEPESNKNAPH